MVGAVGRASAEFRRSVPAAHTISLGKHHNWGIIDLRGYPGVHITCEEEVLAPISTLKVECARADTRGSERDTPLADY